MRKGLRKVRCSPSTLQKRPPSDCPKIKMFLWGRAGAVAGEKSFHSVSEQARKQGKREDTGYEVAVSNKFEQRRLLSDWLSDFVVFSLLTARKGVNKDGCQSQSSPSFHRSESFVQDGMERFTKCDVFLSAYSTYRGR